MSTPVFHAFPAPAKLNLTLSVVGRRADGYHLLETVFRFIDLHDTLYLAPRADGAIVLETPLPGVAPERDLSVRAARLLQRLSGSQQGVTLRIEKRIPLGGGLAGGSSDAATVLLALNQLWNTQIPRAQLQQAAVELGADVPVFIFGQAAFASGIGDELTVCEVPDAWYVVLRPPVHVPTAQVFSSDRLTRNSTMSIMRSLSAGHRKNDLQNVVCEMFPEVQTCLQRLSQYGSPLMTGSGSCVFLECQTEQEAKTVYQSLSSSYTGFVARGLLHHPLFEAQ